MVFIIFSSLILSFIATFMLLFHQVGFSLVLFVIMFLGFLIAILKYNWRIKNNKYLLYIIPILLLSSTYFIFNNSYFSFFNYIAILVLFNIMVIGGINGNVKIDNFFNNAINILLEPLDNKKEVVKEITNLSVFKNSKKENLKIIKAIGISIPILGIVLYLLSRSEEVFAKMFRNLSTIVYNFDIGNIIFKVVLLIIVFIYLVLFFYYLVKVFKVETNDKELKTFNSKTTFNILFVSLNIIYLIYVILQIKSFGVYLLKDNSHYAYYARSGFFELMFVTFINVSIILISTRYKNKDKFMNIMSTIMIGFTYILLSLAFLRMRFYEITYGYTMLRLFVYIILFTEGIMLIPTIVYIWKGDLKLINIYFIIGVVVYTLINFINFDYIIAKENINRYSKTGELDIHYLVHSLGVDASEEILKLQSDEQFSEEIYQYKEKLRNINDSYDNSWMSYNIGREKIKKIFK